MIKLYILKDLFLFFIFILLFIISFLYIIYNYINKRKEKYNYDDYKDRKVFILNPYTEIKLKNLLNSFFNELVIGLDCEWISNVLIYYY